MKTSVIILAMSHITSIFCGFSYDFYDDEFAISEKDDKCGASFNPCLLYKQIQNEYSNCVILRFYFKEIMRILSKICKCNDKCESHSVERRTTNSALCHGQFSKRYHHALYVYFKNCLYLVNPIFFKEYQDALKCNQFDVCYFLIQRTLCPKYVVKKYIDCIKKRCEERHDEKDLAIFLCSSEKFINIKLEIESCKKICPCDITLDICKIYGLDFWERRELLRAIFDHHYCGFLDHENTRDKIIERIEAIYLRATERDIKFTSFIIYQLFADLIACNSDETNIKRIVELLNQYEKEKCPPALMVMVEFFVKVTSYSC